jgi:hypothetical protein
MLEAAWLFYRGIHQWAGRGDGSTHEAIPHVFRLAGGKVGAEVRPRTRHRLPFNFGRQSTTERGAVVSGGLPLAVCVGASTDGLSAAVSLRVGERQSGYVEGRKRDAPPAVTNDPPPGTRTNPTPFWL